MCHFKESYFGLKTYIFCIGGPKMDPKWSQMLPPIPIPGVGKRLLPGGKKLRKNTLLMILYDFSEQIQKR